ncbi:ionotropic receptor 21a [Onthophagus taurus]|uniref:ionotropic receptor 21a n=1 Tax=Onthophagus taurus TaxID=166361 RepID=UPI000C20E09E|nr:ionotropic receptor 21a [Onthophagus taurus]
MNVHVVLAFLAATVECKTRKRALQKSHEKPQIDKWTDKILGKDFFNQDSTLANLISTVINNHLKDCVPIIIYDNHSRNKSSLLDQILKKSEISILHGQISDDFTLKQRRLMDPQPNACKSYVLLLQDVIKTKDILKLKTSEKIVIVTSASQWRVNEFLYSELSRSFVNLLIISPTLDSLVNNEAYVLYTHKLYIDGLGSSEPTILTSWINNSFTRPEVQLFPQKLEKGFSGHRFITSLSNQPPFVIKTGTDDNEDIVWDGSEVRLLKLLSEKFNFSIDFKESITDVEKSPADTVIDSVIENKAIVGISGIYITTERLRDLDVTYPHTQDCAAFISLTSTALPRYRAILGPFHWSVWAALTTAYLLGIFPLVFADKHTLVHLIKNPEEIENMFWYVFGTFTNCFTFGKESWTKSDKNTPRILMGFYWIFTTIVTACYTGSIIAFITLPIYPITIDTVRQLLSGRFQIGTLNKGGWDYWFKNSTDPYTEKLFKNVEYLPNIESGLKNTTKAFFWPYAFLGSRAQLDYIIRTKFTSTNKRQLLHISSECFVPFGVSIIFEKNSEYKDFINKGIGNMIETGFMIKFQNDIEWNMMRSSTGKLLQANTGNNLRSIIVDDRSLSLDDTQGIFLLLGAGFLMGLAALISEMLGGCFNCCKRRRLSGISLKSNPRVFAVATPREKIDSNLIKNDDLETKFFGDHFDAFEEAEEVPSGE